MNSTLSTTTSFHKHRYTLAPKINQTFLDERQQMIRVKSEWRLLKNNEMFHDYMFLRDAESVKTSMTLAQRRSSIVNVTGFGWNLTQKKQERLTRLGSIKSHSQLNEQTPRGGQIDKLILDEAVEKVERLCQRVLNEQLEALVPLMDQVMALFKQSGIISFFFISVYLCSQIQLIYCRRKDTYLIWKRFLRTCNIQGQLLLKYKLVAYRQMARCCLDINDKDKAIVYLKKMLKLSWVVKDRDYELLSYDILALVYYYSGDVERAQFFHSKFTNGEYEPLDSHIRQAGASMYMTGMRLKKERIDQDSNSEDDLDLDVIVQKDNLSRWQRGLPQFNNHGKNQQRVLLNQISCNRDVTMHLLLREKQKLREEDVGFIPINQNIKKLLRLFAFDVKYYLKNGNLYNLD